MIPFRSERYSLLVVIVAAVLIVQATVGAGAVGGVDTASVEAGDELAVQQANNTTTSNGDGTTTGGNNTTNATDNQTGAPGAGGFGFGPDPVELFMDILDEFVGALVDIGEIPFEVLNDFVFNVPAPGDPDDPSTWTSPNGGMWSGVYGAMGYTVALAIVMLGGAIGVSFLHFDEYARRQAWKRCALSGLLVILGIAVPAVVLHGGNALVRGLRPSAEAFFQTPENMGKLGAGIGLGLVLGIFQTATVAGAIVVLALERMLIYVTVYLWPLAWACYAYTGFVRSLGQTVIYLFGVVVAMKFVQALVVRLLFELPWWDGNLFTPLASLAMTVGGLGFALVLFPKAMMDHANDAASVSLGTAAAHREGGRYVEQSADRAYEAVHGKYESYRSETTEVDTDEDPIHVGEVQAERAETATGSSIEPREYRGVTHTTPTGDLDGLDASTLAEQQKHIDQDDSDF